MTQRILLAGSTGLVGHLVQNQLAKQPNLELISLIRHGSSATGHMIDYEALCQNPENLLTPITPNGIDLAISCLGTTIRTAGSQDAMFRVDHDYVLAFAKSARARGARHFILISAAGAGGPGFYLQTKHKIETAISKLDFERIDIIRPGFLLGSRNEKRTWEAIGQRIFAALTPVMFGPLSRYGAIQAETVASAIVTLTQRTTPQQNIYENDALKRLA